MNGHYLDAVAFTSLFRRRRVNHAQICAGLFTIVANVARRFAFARLDERNDAVAEATLIAIQRIDRFKFTKGADAFTYYSSLAHNAIRRQLRFLKRQRSRAALFVDLEAQFDSERDDWVTKSRRTGLAPLDSAVPYAHAV